LKEKEYVGEGILKNKNSIFQDIIQFESEKNIDISISVTCD